MREPPIVGEERRGVHVGMGRMEDGEVGRTDEVVRGEEWGLELSTLPTVVAAFRPK